MFMVWCMQSMLRIGEGDNDLMCGIYTVNFAKCSCFLHVRNHVFDYDATCVPMGLARRCTYKLLNLCKNHLRYIDQKCCGDFLCVMMCGVPLGNAIPPQCWWDFIRSEYHIFWNHYRFSSVVLSMYHCPVSCACQCLTPRMLMFSFQHVSMKMFAFFYVFWFFII